MKILILGAGRVGESVAESLLGEKNDITVIDTDGVRLRDLEARFDLRGVVGNGISPDVLAEAGAADTDMLIACTSQDETNLVACKVAQVVFNIPTRIVRVRSMALKNQPALLEEGGFGVTHAFCPEEALMGYIGKLVRYPEALQVREFAQGYAALASVRARGGAPLVGLSVADVQQNLPQGAVRVVGIYRRFHHEADRLVSVEGSTRIEPGDEVFVLSDKEHLGDVLAAFNRQVGELEQPVRRVMVAGGGRVGMRLARSLTKDSKRFQVKIIEKHESRCVYLASRLSSDVLVLRGDATDENLMEEENVEDVDLFIAITDDDEDNIMSCLLAKKLGATRVLALINRRTYADLMHGTQIDIALSPAQATLGELLAYVRQGDVQAVHSLRRGVAEAIEIVARGDAKTSRVVGKRVGSLRLPHDVHIGMIVRGLPEPDARNTNGSEAPEREGQAADAKEPPQVIVPTSGTIIQSNDHVILFLPNKRLVHEVESLFRVGVTFF
ncbi:trk system potassium uptake protein TrkA [Comamonas odontotermitis]|uniref:Trk system potassium uptake protein TrkA n=1 Tax=Comamonas odontotermitis TaxID=379895 RepID=A0ABR6RKJ1_9BURK|nr:Trk system potassium transporter TrkA [Comamonas odontotermitis]MBB6579700.1 trk system potassium uptake protein TrkA [Comamonas odontotermitis]